MASRGGHRRIVSAIVFVIKNGLRWRDAPPGYGPHKTIYNRFVRWSRLGVFNKIFELCLNLGDGVDQAAELFARDFDSSLILHVRSSATGFDLAVAPGL